LDKEDDGLRIVPLTGWEVYDGMYSLPGAAPVPELVPRTMDEAEGLDATPGDLQEDPAPGTANGKEDDPQLSGKIAEAVQLAHCFAERWESPFQSVTEEAADCKVPSLFSICGQRLVKAAKQSSVLRFQLTRDVPESILERLGAECGCGRLQMEDFVAKVGLDPKDTAGLDGMRGHRKRRKKGKPGPGRGVCISTIHAAKGLEWPVVFVAHWNEGFLPMSPSNVEELAPDGRRVKREPTPEEAAEHQEEERRLAHVAVTRAQRRLILTHVRSFSSRRKDNAIVSSLPLPEPVLPEWSQNAAIWTREMPRSEIEIQWEGQDGSEA
jgi:hypothetical protein